MSMGSKSPRCCTSTVVTSTAVSPIRVRIGKPLFISIIQGTGHLDPQWYTQQFRSGPGKPNQRKVSSWTFRRGVPEQKFDMWIVLAFPRKNTRIHKNGRNSWTFRFGPFFGLVCRGDSWSAIHFWDRLGRGHCRKNSAISAKFPQTFRRISVNPCF